MAISSSSRRIQLTLNEDKEKEKVVLDYLDSSFNETQEIKRILFEYIVNQTGVKVAKNSKSKKKSSKVTKGKSKRAKDNKSDEKLLTITQNDAEIVKDNKSDSKIIKESNDNSNIVPNNDSDDFTIDLSNFNDEPIEVKSTNKENETDVLRQNELNELSKFM